MKTKTVSIADMKIAKNGEKLITLGLGSCVSVTLYDKKSKVGGMTHSMLPKREKINDNQNLAKFIDSSILLCLEEMKKKGATIKNIEAKVFGGAQVFKLTAVEKTKSIGYKNYTRAYEILEEMNIPIVYKEVGGDKARTITLDTKNGDVLVSTVDKNEKVV